MLPDEPQPVDEKKILTTQYIAVGMMFVLFIFLSNIITNQVLSASIATLPLLFIGFSSIKYKTSIMRSGHKQEHLTGEQAVTAGKLAIIFYVAGIIFQYVLHYIWSNS